MIPRRLGFILATAFLAALAPLNALAFSEQIISFDSKAALAPNGFMTVDETIQYDFRSQERHGILRDVPYEYTDDAGTKYRPDVKLLSVSQDGQPAEVSPSRHNGVVEWKIGDPDHTITGAHTYEIRYELSPIVQRAGDHDILKFNVTGNGWQVPIESASYSLALPTGITAGTSNCFTGEAGSTASNCTLTNTGFVVTATADGLGDGSGLSVFTELPANSVANYLQPYVPPKPSPSLLALPALTLVMVVVALGLLAAKALADRRLRRAQTIIAEYEAPDNLRPAELGLLADDRTGMPEITATLIDLAVRGHMRIEQTRAKSLFRKADYTFHRLTSTDQLEPYEQKLLDALFDDNPQPLKSVDRTAMAAAVTKVKTQLANGLKQRGWYVRKPSPGRWRWPIITSLVAAGLAIGTGIYLAQPDTPKFHGNLAALAGLAVAVVSFFLARRADGLTPEGAAEWAKVQGFKEYLSVAEKARLDFSDAPEKTPERFNALLPFAIALGVEQAWAKQFEGIDVAPASGWYYGYNPTAFNAGFLASSLGSDFAGGVASNFSPPSSSGSSSGGFSGGGFGGGGGGSW